MIFLKQYDLEKGFTLIEVIAVLLLVGILASVAGLGIVQATKAFLFTQNTSEMGQKNVLPMTRLRRSVANLTQVTTATSTTISLDRLSNGEKVTETYAWSGMAGAPLTLTTTDGNGAVSGPHNLVDDVQAFFLDYETQSGNSGSWSLGDRISTLAYVTTNLTLSGGDGSQNMLFAEHIVPRNTFIPSDAAPGTAQGTTSSEFNFCFIKSKLYGDSNLKIVDMYRNVRQKLLQSGIVGEKIVLGYKITSPRLCLLVDKFPCLMPFLKVVFLPLTGFLFLIFYFPWAFLALAVIAWLLLRMINMQGIKILPMEFIRNARGSVLLGVIITMVIMSVLSAAMLGMFSSSLIGTVSPQFSQKAYYLAESGLAYAAQRYLKNDDNDTGFVNDLNLGNSIPVGSDSFAIELESFWFNNTTAANSGQITVSAFGAFPANVSAGLSGYVQVPVSGGNSVEQYTNTSFSGLSLRFTLAGNVAYTAGDVFPAMIANAQTITANEMGEDPDLSSHVLTPSNAGHIEIFPEINGIIQFSDPDGNDHVLVYRKKKNGKLTGLQYPKGVSFPSSGIAIDNNTQVVLGKHAIITSTGTAGTGEFQSNQTIKLHQPLSTIELFKKIEGGIDFNDGSTDKIESKLGTHAVEDGALKVTSTDQTYSYTNYTSSDGHTGPVTHNESLAVVNWDNFETDFLKDIWEKSDNKLSYDLQAKVKFTETEDDVDNHPINHPGCYMPGLSFRIRSPKTGDFGQATYYGLSFMRGITGVEEYETSTGSGCGSSTTYWYSEKDDITDNFFNDHTSTNSAGTIQVCPDSSFTPNNWNDDPPLDGIPYVVLWQKDVSTNSSGNPVNTGGCGGGEDYSPWEWLAYAPLVDALRVKIYHYRIDGQHLFYEGINSSLDGSDLQGTYWSWKLKDRYGVLKTNIWNGVTILGTPGPSGIVILDPATYVSTNNPGTPVNTFDGATCPVGFIRVPTIDNEDRKASYNYKIYIKSWASIMVRVYEMEGDLDCNSATGDVDGKERVNAISAFMSDPDGGAGSLGYSKDTARSAYPRDTVKWPNEGDYFTQVVWKGLRNSTGPVFDSETGYTSKTVSNPEANGCGALNATIKIVEKGKDSEGDNVVVYTSTYTTEGYFQNSNAYEVSEFGLHTLGINGESSDPNDQEVAYFDDFYWLLWEGGQSGLFPGIQEQ